jgi:hypothetical protein
MYLSHDSKNYKSINKFPQAHNNNTIPPGVECMNSAAPTFFGPGPLWEKCEAAATANAEICSKLAHSTDYCTHEGAVKEQIYDCDGDGRGIYDCDLRLQQVCEWDGDGGSF